MADSRAIVIHAGRSATRFKAAPGNARKKPTLNKLYTALYPSSIECENDTTNLEDLMTKKATVPEDCDGNSTPTTLGEVWDAVISFFDPSANEASVGMWMIVDGAIRLTRDGKRKAATGGKRKPADNLQQVSFLTD